MFNRTGVGGCDRLINMLAENDIPALFVSRTNGFRILGASLTGYTCSEDGTGTPAPPVGTDASTVDLRPVFDGWDYIHLFDAETMTDLDQFAIPEAHDPAFAADHGDLSVHEVATDPDEELIYSSYYAGGLRVLTYEDGDLQQAGAFIAGDGMATVSGTPVTPTRQQLLGRRGPQAPQRPEVHPRLRPRLRRLDLPVQPDRAVASGPPRRSPRR